MQPWLYIRITWETFETTDDYNVWLGLKTIVKMDLLQVEICKTEPLSSKGIQILISSYVYIVHILLPPSAPPEGFFFPLGCFFFLDGEHYPNLSLYVCMFSLRKEERESDGKEGRNGGG